MIFVDTNYFLRFLLAVANSQQRKAKKLFTDAASGKVKLFTSSLVIFEIYWVLTSFYKKPKKELIRVLQGLLEMKFIRFQDSYLLIKALALYKKNKIEFDDCYNLAYAKQAKADDFATFDKAPLKAANV